jgi:hypothetical protein
MRMKIPDDYLPVVSNYELEKKSMKNVEANKKSSSLINNVNPMNVNNVENNDNNDDNAVVSADTARILYPLQQILKEIKSITHHIADSTEQYKLATEWQFAAKVVDRFCLCTFTLFLVASFLYVLIAAPYLMA